MNMSYYRDSWRTITSTACYRCGERVAVDSEDDNNIYDALDIHYKTTGCKRVVNLHQLLPIETNRLLKLTFLEK